MDKYFNSVANNVSPTYKMSYDVATSLKQNLSIFLFTTTIFHGILQVTIRLKLTNRGQVHGLREAGKYKFENLSSVGVILYIVRG